MQNKISTKIAILIISIFLMSHLAIAPAIPKLYELYHGVNSNIGLASVETLVTIPAMMITIFVVLSNFFISFLGKKKTVILGLVLILISGIVSFLSTSYTVVLISRLVLGAGIGLYNSISISIISDYYDGETRDTMIGYRTAFLNIGKALTTFIAGYALLIGANYTFLVYLLVLPVLIYFIKYLPTNNKEIKGIKHNFTFNFKAILIMLITFFVGISYIGATIKIPTLLVTKYGIANTTASDILTILALSGIVIGFVFGKLIKSIGNKTLPTMALAMATGNFLFTTTNNIFVFYTAAILIGASFVGTMSFMFYYISNHYKKEHINFITSLALLAGNIGVILTPVFLTKIPEKFNLELFVTPFYITTIFALFNFALYIVLPKK